MKFEKLLLEIYGFKSQTTLWAEFGQANIRGAKAVTEMFTRYNIRVADVNFWKEMCITLKLRCCKHFEEGNFLLSSLYSTLFCKARVLGYSEYLDYEDDLDNFHNFIYKLDKDKASAIIFSDKIARKHFSSRK